MFNDRGGVLNIQSSLSDAKNEILSIPILNNNSVFRTSQNGVANQNQNFTQSGDRTWVFEIPITHIEDINKVFWEENLSFSLSEGSLRGHSIELLNDSIKCTVNIFLMSYEVPATLSMSGNWKILEFY